MVTQFSFRICTIRIILSCLSDRTISCKVKCNAYPVSYMVFIFRRNGKLWHKVSPTNNSKSTNAEFGIVQCMLLLLSNHVTWTVGISIEPLQSINGRFTVYGRVSIFPVETRLNIAKLLIPPNVLVSFLILSATASGIKADVSAH